MERKTGLAIASLISSTLLVFYKLLLPTTVQIIIEGLTVEVKQIPSLYYLTDVIVIAVSSFVMGISMIYLLLPRPTPPFVPPSRPANLEYWGQVLDGLKDESERRIYQILMEENGVIFQSELTERSGFPKGKVSLTLDKLEARGLLERRRRGMSNVVILKCK